MTPNVSFPFILMYEKYEKDHKSYTEGGDFRNSIISTEFYHYTLEELKIYPTYYRYYYLLFKPI